MDGFDLPLTVGFFLIVTGILTWTGLAIAGVWWAFSLLEMVLDRIQGVKHRRRLVKIYRPG